MKAILCVTVVCAMSYWGLSMLVGPDAGSGSVSRTAGTESAVVGGDKVKGLGATRLLVQQADRRESVIAEMRRLQVRNDFDGIVRVLSSRADELDVVIAKVSASGSYSIRDKQIMLRVLEKDRKWARESYIGLATL